MVGGFLLDCKSLAYEEYRSNTEDCVKFRECYENQSVSEYIVSVSDGGDTVGGKLTLADGTQKTYQTACQAGTED